MKNISKSKNKKNADVRTDNTPLGKNYKVFLLYAILICAVYAQVVFFNKSLIPTLYYPKRFIATDCPGRLPVNRFNIDLASPAFYEMPINLLVGNMYKNKELPLWNPYQGCGTPLSAQYSTRVFFPYQILENASPPATWDYFILGRLVIAAFFTYLFLLLIGISSPCAFLGGILYSLSGSFVWFINLEEFTNTAMILPICLFCLERLLQYKRPRYIAECTIAFALMLLAGQPEIAIYVMLLAAGYYVFRIIIERPSFLLFFKNLSKFIIIILLGLSLCSFLILPFLELIPNAYQCHPPGGDMGVREPTALYVAASILLPSFFQLPTYYRMVAINGIWDWLGGYTGVLMIYLILLGFFYKNNFYKYFLFFSLFGFAVVLKNFGFPLIAWIGKLPLLNQSWSPRWAGCAWTFSLAAGAAIGLENVSRASIKKKILPLGVSFFLLSLIAFLSYKTTYFSQLKGLDANTLKIVLPPIFGGLIASLCLIIAATFLMLYHKNKKWFLWSIIALAITELWFYIPKGDRFPQTVLKFIPFVLGIIVVFLLAQGKKRLAMTGILLAVFSYTFIDIKSPFGFPEKYELFTDRPYIDFLKENAGYYRIAAGDGLLMPNFSSAYGLYDIRYVNSLSIASYQNYADNHLLKEPLLAITDRLWFTGLTDMRKNQLYNIPQAKQRSIYNELKDNLMHYSYLGLKYIITPKNIFLDFPLAYDNEVKIYENPACIPRVYIARGVKYVSDYRIAQELLDDKNFDIRNEVFLEEKAPEWYKCPNGEDYCQAQITEYNPNDVTVKAQLQHDGILVLTDVFYPGWKAYANSKETKIYRINGLVRGIFLEKGDYEVKFVYFPFSFKLGLLISGIALIICIWLWIKDIKR